MQLPVVFPTLQVPMPEQLQPLGYDELQFTLVDCPGHASLIRTIIGGAQIIDTMILVIDVTKGTCVQGPCLVATAGHSMLATSGTKMACTRM